MHLSYVGPASLLDLAKRTEPGTVLACEADLMAWLAQQEVGLEIPGEVVATYVVDLTGRLRLAPRRNEHVVCAGGVPVLGAGELSLFPDGDLSFVTNQSTGYCPPLSSWPAVAAALDTVGIEHDGSFTTEFTFRLCTGCGQRNLVKEAWFICAMCEAELPSDWNFQD